MEDANDSVTAERACEGSLSWAQVSCCIVGGGRSFLTTDWVFAGHIPSSHPPLIGTCSLSPTHLDHHGRGEPVSLLGEMETKRKLLKQQLQSNRPPESCLEFALPCPCFAKTNLGKPEAPAPCIRQVLEVRSGHSWPLVFSVRGSPTKASFAISPLD